FPPVPPDFDDEVNPGGWTPPTGPFVPGTPTPEMTGAGPIAAPGGPHTEAGTGGVPTHRRLGLSGSTTAEPSGASGGGVVFVTSNWFAAYSTDDGVSWTRLNPTTIFPNDAVGFCCDQIVQYLPSVDRFVWFLQGNGYRLAVASPAQIIA